MQPLTLCAYKVDVAPVVDARDAADRARLGIADADLRCPNWEREMLDRRIPASQALADRLIAAGIAGMLVSSFARGARPDDVSLVFWRWGDALPFRIVVIDDEDRLRR